LYLFLQSIKILFVSKKDCRYIKRIF